MRARDRWPELCDLVRTDDGLPVRDCGAWTEDKLFYWHRYIEITTVGMKSRWPNKLVYVDLFAGPGVCVNKETGKRIPGSPLLAAAASVPFRRMILVESDHALADAAERRLRALTSDQDVRVIPGDCNQVMDQVVKAVPSDSLALAFIDPEGLQVRFDTLRRLAACARVDLLILFPVGYDILRNIRLYELQDDSKLDEVLGSGSQWRAQWPEVVNRESAKVIRFFTDEYKRRLREELSYEHVDDVSIKSRGRVFYKLIYASGHERGVDFWRKALRKERGGQMGFGY